MAKKQDTNGPVKQPRKPKSLEELGITGELTLEIVEKKINEVFAMNDDAACRFVFSNPVANAMHRSPVWSIIVGPPSGGKSELILALGMLVDYVYPLSDLTEHTFASGFNAAGGNDVSLLYAVENKTILMKDLTTIAEGNQDRTRQILAQLREIYDGQFIKAYGTGQKTAWEGHVGMLCAITEKGMSKLQAYAGMGERFTAYHLGQPDRMAVLDKAFDNEDRNMRALREDIQDLVYHYLSPILRRARALNPNEKIPIDERIRQNIKEVANFSALARSSVDTDFKTNRVLFTLPPEMPTRLAKQIFQQAAALKFMKGDLDAIDEKMLYKIGISSIPLSRMAVIKALTEYKSATQASLSGYLGLPIKTVEDITATVAALGIAYRTKPSNVVIWKLKPEYRNVVTKFAGIKQKDEDIPEKYAKDAELMSETSSDYNPELEAQTMEDMEKEAARELNAPAMTPEEMDAFESNQDYVPDDD